MTTSTFRPHIPAELSDKIRKEITQLEVPNHACLLLVREEMEHQCNVQRRFVLQQRALNKSRGLSALIQILTDDETTLNPQDLAYLKLLAKGGSDV